MQLISIANLFFIDLSNELKILLTLHPLFLFEARNKNLSFQLGHKRRLNCILNKFLPERTLLAKGLFFLFNQNKLLPI